jgi:hypothetical protein
MPNPPLVSVESAKSLHFLALVDLFITIGMPKVYVVEPPVNKEYRPDVYTRLDGVPTMIEYQRTTISNELMQSKVDRFHAALNRGQHDARVLWIASEAKQYKVETPEGIIIAQFKPNLVATISTKNKPY